jgi:TGF-beta receptor type-1
MSSVDGVSEEYAQPYFEFVDPDPGLDEMRQVVCDKGIRPTIPERWQAEEPLRLLSKVMRECWYPNAGARLTALRIKKTLGGNDGNRDVDVNSDSANHSFCSKETSDESF